MRRIIATQVLILLGMVSYGQVQKGDFNIGTNIGYLSQKGDNELNDYTFANIGANLQYYITDNISIGFGPSFGRMEVFGGSTSQSTTALNFSVDYAFLSKSGKTLPYFGARFSMYNNEVNVDNSFFTELFGLSTPVIGGLSDINVAYKRQIAAVSAGIKFFVTERINIDNNLVLGTVIDQKIEYDVGNFAPIGGAATVDGPTGDMLIQFTIGFGYIIGARGT